MKSILKRIWNQRKSNAWILSELCIVFVLLWYATDFLFVYAKIGSESKGCNTEHVYRVSILTNPLLNIHTKNQDSVRTFKIKPFKEIVRRISKYPGVESACCFRGSDCYSDINMFQGYSIDSVNIVRALIRYVTSDYEKVFKVSLNEGGFNNWSIAENPYPAILTSDFADSLFISKPKLGQTFIDYYSGGKKYKVVGIAPRNKTDELSKYHKCIYVPMDEEEFAYGPAKIAIRVRASDDHLFAENFMKKMKKELQVGPYYLFSIQSYDDNQAIYEAAKGISNYIKGSIAFVLFFVTNIFLGIIGTFWFRTQSRSSEIGLRVALGSTKRGLRGWMVAEGIMLLNIAVIPALIISLNIVNAELTFNKLLDASILRFVICSSITYLLMAIMVVLGVWYPAKVASNILPVEALRNE